MGCDLTVETGCGAPGPDAVVAGAGDDLAAVGGDREAGDLPRVPDAMLQAPWGHGRMEAEGRSRVLLEPRGEGSGRDLPKGGSVVPRGRGAPEGGSVETRCRGRWEGEGGGQGIQPESGGGGGPPPLSPTTNP